MNENKRPSDQPRPISRSLPLALLHAREVVMRQFRPLLAEHDVSEQQWRVLRALNEVRYLDASELANRASILPPSLTRILKALERRNLIHTGKFDKDGRKVLIAITPEGVSLIQEILPNSRAIYAKIDKRFGRDKVEQLLNLLEELVHCEEQLMTGPKSGE